MKIYNVTIDYDEKNGNMSEVEANSEIEAISIALKQEGLCRYIECEEVSK